MRERNVEKIDQDIERQVNGALGISKSDHAIEGDSYLETGPWQNVSRIKIVNETDERLFATVEFIPENPQGKIVVYLRARVG